jgi:DNA-binding MarR family transcriptional regulator
MYGSVNIRHLKEIAQLDLAIHTPARLMIINLLHQSNTQDFIQIMSQTELTWGNLSTHLTKLEEAGYVMITKTFKGKRPHTLISLTESGRQAYLGWGRSIIKALPEGVKQQFVPAAIYEQADEELAALAMNSDMPVAPNRDVFFLPKYHRWGMDLPPIKEFNQLS